MTLSDLLTTCRTLLADTDTGGFFSDSDLTLFINEGQNKLSIKLRWPPMNLTRSTVANTQEYTLPESVLAVYSVYLAGQPLVPTTKPIMEGWGQELWDDTGPQYQPEWQKLDMAQYPNPAAYPVSATYQGVIIDQVPGAPVKPSWYPWGANIGIIPTPNGIFTLTVLGIAFPPQLASGTDTCIFPELARYTIAHKALQLARESERHYDEAQYFQGQFEGDIPDLIAWKNNLYPQQNRIQYRSYRYGQPRMVRH